MWLIQCVLNVGQVAFELDVHDCAQNLAHSAYVVIRHVLTPRSAGKKKAKTFFFEKKNQKSFLDSFRLGDSLNLSPTLAKVFWFFFP